jgi:hypothetical protein
MKHIKNLFLILLLSIYSNQTHALIQQNLNSIQLSPVNPGGSPESSFIIDDSTWESSVGSGPGVQFIWLNRFTPNAFEFPFQLEEILMVLGSSATGSVGDTIRILIYEDTDGDGDPGTGAVLLLDYNEAILFFDQTTFNVYDLPSPIRLDGPGDVLIGIVNSYSGAGGFNDSPATIDTTTTNERSWVGTYLGGEVPVSPTLPADAIWATIDSFGTPGNWIVRGAGTHIALPVPSLNYMGLLILVSLLMVLFMFRNKIIKQKI